MNYNQIIRNGHDILKFNLKIITKTNHVIIYRLLPIRKYSDYIALHIIFKRYLL